MELSPEQVKLLKGGLCVMCGTSASAVGSAYCYEFVREGECGEQAESE